jgi:hypothetical protein
MLSGIHTLAQISAGTRALQAVSVGLLEDHLGHREREAIESDKTMATPRVKWRPEVSNDSSARDRMQRWQESGGKTINVRARARHTLWSELSRGCDRNPSQATPANQ